MNELKQVRAAGGVPVRISPDGGIQVAVVHRARYDDWSLPKGKLDPGEGWSEAALREVHEETGLRCRLGSQLPSSHYIDHRGRPKEVRWWLMVPDSGRFEPSEEVDELCWLGVEEALGLLSYAHDRTLVQQAARLAAQEAQAGSEP